MAPTPETTSLHARVMNALVPWAKDAPPDLRFSGELVASMSAIFTVMATFFCGEIWIREQGYGLGTFLICVLGVLVFGGNLLLARQQRYATVAAWVFISALTFLMGSAGYFTGGYRTMYSPWEVTIPLLAIFLVGKRGGVVVAVALIAQELLIWALEATGLFIPPHAELMPSAVTTFVSIVVVLAMVVGVGILHERGHGVRRKQLADTIDALRTAHAGLAAAQSQLVANEKLSSLGMLAAGIAHEINNPMSFVTSNVAALKRDLPTLLGEPELYKEYVEEVLPATLDGIARVNSIVGDLRRFARGDPSSFVDYDLNAEIAAAVRMARSEIAKRGSKIECDLAQLPSISGHPRQVMQVVMNLVVNAAQANSEGGTVRVASWANGDEVAIKVEDTGVGMSEETLKRLFQPFFTTKRVGEGTGLGLAVAHGIVSSHGGRIEVQSSPGRGSAFTVWLPRVPAPLAVAQPKMALG